MSDMIGGIEIIEVDIETIRGDKVEREVSYTLYKEGKWQIHRCPCCAQFIKSRGAAVKIAFAINDGRVPEPTS